MGPCEKHHAKSLNTRLVFKRWAATLLAKSATFVVSNDASLEPKGVLNKTEEEEHLAAMSWWGLGASLALAAQGFEAVLRGFFHKELPSLLRVFHGCFLPARFPSCLQVKECFRTAARSRRPRSAIFLN